MGKSHEPHTITKLSGREQTPNPALLEQRNLETLYSSSYEDSDLQGLPMGVQAWDIGKSEGQFVMNWIRVSTSLGLKRSPRPIGLLLRDSLQNL